MEPAFAVDSICRCLGHFVVTLHNVVAACYELAVCIVRKFFIGLRVNYLALNTEDRSANGIDTLF